MQLWMLFVLGTIFCWGLYGPTLHTGQMGFEDTVRSNNTMRAMVCVGAAYFLVAVLIPVIVLGKNGQLGGFNMKGTMYATGAGLLGAFGAFCIAWAFKNGGKPIIVMPLVFAGAPIINTLTSIISHPPKEERLSPLLYVGFILAAVGAYLVLAYKPES